MKSNIEVKIVNLKIPSSKIDSFRRKIAIRFRCYGFQSVSYFFPFANLKHLKYYGIETVEDITAYGSKVIYLTFNGKMISPDYCYSDEYSPRIKKAVRKELLCDVNRFLSSLIEKKILGEKLSVSEKNIIVQLLHKNRLLING